MSTTARTMISVTSVVRKARRRRIADQQAVDQADSGAAGQRRRDHRRHGPSGDVEQRERDDIAKREGGADAQVDAARHHDDHQRQDDEG